MGWRLGGGWTNARGRMPWTTSGNMHRAADSPACPPRGGNGASAVLSKQSTGRHATDVQRQPNSPPRHFESAARPPFLQCVLLHDGWHVHEKDTSDWILRRRKPSKV